MKLFAASLLDELADKAAASPRRRAHFNVHATPADVVQRFFVVACRNTYFRPHRHTARSELALILRGSFEVITFDEAGVVTARYAVGDTAANMGYELPPATWHTLLALSDGAAFLEVKQGPYDPTTAAQFAEWAPAEGDATAGQFLERARRTQVGERV